MAMEVRRDSQTRSALEMFKISSQHLLSTEAMSHIRARLISNIYIYLCTDHFWRL